MIFCLVGIADAEERNIQGDRRMKLDNNNLGHDFLVYGTFFAVGSVLLYYEMPVLGGIGWLVGALGLSILAVRVIYRLLQKV
jgi:hypothetical protein